MGLHMGFSSSSGDKSHSIAGSSLRPSSSKYDGKVLVEAEQKSLPNPNPINYKIVKHRQVGDYLVIKIKYLDCTNYEGVKILIFKTTLKELIAQKYIDPHFCENEKFISPIARFVPTLEGWSDAYVYANLKKTSDENRLKK